MVVESPLGGGLEVTLTARFPVAQGPPAGASLRAGEPGPPAWPTSAAPEERALAAVIALLGLHYPLFPAGEAAPELGADVGEAAHPLVVHVAVPGGWVVADGRGGGGEVQLTWKPALGRGSLTLLDLYVVCVLFTVAALCSNSAAAGTFARPSPRAGDTSPATTAHGAFSLSTPPSLGELAAWARGGAPPSWDTWDRWTFLFLLNYCRGVVDGASAAAMTTGTQREGAGREREAGGGNGLPSLDGKQKGPDPTMEPEAFLKSLGIALHTPQSHAVEGITWDCLAGGDEIKKRVEEEVLLPMQRPALYKALTAQTRARQEPIGSGTFVFLGPPGTGKTTTARIIAAQGQGRPLVVLNFENIGCA